MQTIHLENRLTFKYVGEYRDMDKWEYVGLLRHTPFRKTYDPRLDESADVSTGPSYVAWARLPAGVDAQAWAKAIRDSFTRQGCACEHDCCGCQSTSARVDVRGRRVRIRLGVSFNY